MQNFTHGYALLIGVGESAYPKLIPSLPVTVNNTQAIRAALINPELCGYAENNIRVLNNKEATKANILEGLKWLADQDSQATIFIYYSGHGYLDKTDKDSYYLLQHDAKLFELASSALSGKEFTEALGKIKAERLLVVIESCHAAGMATPESPEEFENFQPINPSKGLVSEWKQGKGRAVFTSSQGEQKSWIQKGNSMSIYTLHFLEALKGAGNKPGDTEVTISDLMKHLDEAVPKTAQDMGKKQNPHFAFNTSNFAIANLRGGKGLPDWTSICQTALDTRKKRLTTNPLTTGDDIEFNLDDIYVPLGLKEKVKKDQISSEIYPESDSQMDHSEVTLTYKIDEFFTQVLKQGESRRSQGRKLAIVGKAGAGKTTLLQKIAQWVMDETEDFAIWVSLAALRGQTLEDYLLERWLKNNVGETEVTTEMKNALISLFERGRVFLLLDGIDEMASMNPLEKLAEEITNKPWLASARLVVTCRQNVWDAGSNPLVGFDVYRNLGFEYPDEMKTFIQGWFAKNLELGEQLMKELGQPGKERIRDMVKNPLRLALLCRTWEVRQGKLPETKADLYKEFTDTLYEWKKEAFPTKSKQRKELNAKLSKLALQAMEQSECRFRLKESLVTDILGEKDEHLCDLAVKLGWLNSVRVAVENHKEEVYAFYHPTFQEYFAALAIDDLSDFLKPNKTCRIFEKQWKEVILLWFGRDDVEKKKKEAFIENLIKWDNVLDKSDKYRAYSLAGAIVREFKESPWSYEIVDQIVKTYCMNLNVRHKEVKAVLLETDKDGVINSLIQLLEKLSDQEKYEIITNCLRDIKVGDKREINSLIELLEQTSAEDTNWIIAHCLYDIAVEHEGAINSLTKLDTQTSDEEALRIMIDWSKLVMQNEIENSNRKLLQIPLTQWLKKLI